VVDGISSSLDPKPGFVSTPAAQTAVGSVPTQSSVKAGGAGALSASDGHAGSSVPTATGAPRIKGMVNGSSSVDVWWRPPALSWADSAGPAVDDIAKYVRRLVKRRGSVALLMMLAHAVEN